MSTTHTMVAVAYRLTMEASHRDAVNAYLEATPAFSYGEQVTASNDHIRRYGALWRVFRGLDGAAMNDGDAIDDARAWLAEHLDELNAFEDKVEARMREGAQS